MEPPNAALRIRFVIILGGISILTNVQCASFLEAKLMYQMYVVQKIVLQTGVMLRSKGKLIIFVAAMVTGILALAF